MDSDQRYRLRAPSTGREIVIEAKPGVIYRDEQSGDEPQHTAAESADFVYHIHEGLFHRGDPTPAFPGERKKSC